MAVMSGGLWTDDQLRTRLWGFVDAYNFARRLKTLMGLTPCEFICRPWTYIYQLQRFKISPRPEIAKTKQPDCRQP
jgi:hypothetical protein